MLSIHEKGQIRAVDHSQAGLLLNLIRCGTMIHHYKRDGTTTLLVALNALEGSFGGGCVQRHWHEEFVHVHKAIEPQCSGWAANRGGGRNLRNPQSPKMKEWSK